MEAPKIDTLTSAQLSVIAKVFQGKRRQGARAAEVRKILGE